VVSSTPFCPTTTKGHREAALRIHEMTTLFIMKLRVNKAKVADVLDICWIRRVWLSWCRSSLHLVFPVGAAPFGSRSAARKLLGTLRCGSIKVGILLLAATCLLWSCAPSVDRSIVAQLGKYKEAKDMIFADLPGIKSAVGFEDHDPVSKVDRNVVFLANRYYFENTIAKGCQEITKVLQLWDAGLVVNNNSLGTIQLNKDSTLIFTSSYADGTFSGVGHYVVFDPGGGNAWLNGANSEILALEQLDESWVYLIVRRYYAD
jgi:hypothetical protein